MPSSEKSLLFQGDSITDCHRERSVEEPNELVSLGRGYVLMAASSLLSAHAAGGLRVFNRGISGNRIVDLYARWKLDALNLQPDIISILIGVNDTWHHFKRNNGVEVDRYEKFYRMLLEWTVSELPSVKLVLCEPFALQCGVVEPAWIAELDERRAVVADLAREFEAVFVPFQPMFDQAAKEAEASYWLHDGVHPTAAGHYRMAQLWLEKVNEAGLLA